MGSPGETQIESDWRQIMDRIVLLEDCLEKVKKTRIQHRAQRSWYTHYRPGWLY
ncbi:MAG: hypothetical protein MO846_00745 [Candidatus Devosia symbiotica]|nr:hypothetical protein [Candidatus Devosia symbiotica]